MHVELKNISVVFEKGTDVEKAALVDINLDFDTNETILLVGNTGSGKTTLIYLLDLLIKPTTGIMRYDGSDPFENPYKYRKKFGVSFQIPERQFFSETVEDEITFAAKNFNTPYDRHKIIELLSVVGLPESILKQSPFKLSGGEQRKVAIASILLHEPEFLIFDEPTAGLDLFGVLAVRDILEKFKKQGRGFLITTHEPELFTDLCERTIVLDNGRIMHQNLKLRVVR
ncbi:MAG: ABC transporter ATP-binding protein [Fervidobacterium sp.]|uniref:Energy-coupling factor transport system ATP-binding protein n=1 Tax=Fervidobacterium gondwanense DSM 13020 TaxID=1121883 RepID=A0A1M7SRL6_FERGO|nr:ABC transporter ATP-binding protein [Fervidobacterium gondwanense]SHN61155.1 energy-coupling factor transport system ATP-binding protein [Fervidobacterium gondwanense DSM 13020]